MIHIDTKLVQISPEKGLGIIATDFIPKGTIVWVKDDIDMIIKKDDFKKLNRLLYNRIRDHVFVEANGDSILCWDFAKYINHSCDSNVITTPYDFEIAVRNIHKGDEVTNDYGYFNTIYKTFRICHCGSSNCRGRVKLDDFILMSDIWDDKISSAMLQYHNVKQPLEHLLNNESMDEIENFMNYGKFTDSIMSLKLK